MNRCRRLAAIALFVVITSSSVFAQQPKHSNLEFLQVKGQRLSNDVREFITFAIANKDTAEFEVGTDLAIMASTANDYVISAQHLLVVYAMLSCKTDQDRVWESIRVDLGYYARLIDLQINQVSRKLSGKKPPALAASGGQMKEDLRELKILFESIQPN